MLKPPLVLDPDQRHVVDLVRQGHNVLATGKAGSGKSLVIAKLRNVLSETAVFLAPTGMAARNIGGVTVHSFFHFPPTFLPPGYVAELTLDLLEAVEFAQTIIIDEVSMLRSDTLAAIDTTLRYYAPAGLAGIPFGGKQIVLVGDFLQLEPVVNSRERLNIVFDHGGCLAFESPVWQEADFRGVFLRQSHRQAADQPFLEALDCLRSSGSPMGPTLAECLGWLNSNIRICETMRPNTTALCATRRDAAAINGFRELELQGPTHACEASRWGTFEQGEWPTEYHLVFRSGSRIMLLANGSDTFGTPFVNGDTGWVRDYDPDKERATIQLDDGREVVVGRFMWPHEKYTVTSHPVSKRPYLKREVIGGFSQLPFRSAWAITVHKSQGLTLESAHLHLGRGMFANGQLYTALSRCRLRGDLSLGRALRLSDVLVDPKVRRFYEELARNQGLAAA